MAINTRSTSAKQVALRDGTKLAILPMEPTDADRLVRFHHGLSPETTRLRFFTFHPELRDSELYRFTHVDHVDREAIIAVVDGDIVGVSRFDRIPGSREADIAFVVADSYQGRGLGTLLFSELAERARAVGVTRFTAATLPDNHRMLHVFQRSGLPKTSRFEDGLAHVVLALDGGTIDPGQQTPESGA